MMRLSFFRKIDFAPAGIRTYAICRSLSKGPMGPDSPRVWGGGLGVLGEIWGGWAGGGGVGTPSTHHFLMYHPQLPPPWCARRAWYVCAWCRYLVRLVCLGLLLCVVV